MRQYFKFIYLMSGRYRVTYTAKIIAWENEIVTIRDRDNKEHTLKEKYIQSMRSVNPHTKSAREHEVENDYEQQDLFAELEE